MKKLIWVLNIIQFLIVYFLVFWLLQAGFIVYPGPSGLSIEGLWPAISIGIAGIPWRYYKRFSLFIMSKRMKAPAEEVVTEEASYNKENKELSLSKTKSTGVLNTFFFGYLSLKWCRLVRTLFVLPSIIYMWIVCDKTFPRCATGPSGTYVNNVLILDPCERLIPMDYREFFISTSFLLLIPLLSWVIKPFVVKED